jgi:hypothetical protein
MIKLRCASFSIGNVPVKFPGGKNIGSMLAVFPLQGKSKSQKEKVFETRRKL